MNRQIKFRGKENFKSKYFPAKWYEGGLMIDGDDAWLCVKKENEGIVSIKVDPDTVGQFTGMLDSNGKEIYEGDILSDGEVKYEVWYSEDRAGFIAEMRDPQNDLVDYLGGYDTERMMTVIGNLHDNPDLLNGK